MYHINQTNDGNIHVVTLDKQFTLSENPKEGKPIDQIRREDSAILFGQIGDVGIEYHKSLSGEEVQNHFYWFLKNNGIDAEKKYYISVQPVRIIKL